MLGHKILYILLFILKFLALIAAGFLVYINWPVGKVDRPVDLGVTFSSKYAEAIQLDPREAYLAVLDDLQIKNIRLPVYWDDVEKEKDKYDFSNIDWQLSEAAKRNAKIILVVGQKVPRWPECFIPEWAKNDDELRKKELLKEIETVVKRYKDNPVVAYWQVENEPFLKFGNCPQLDINLLDSEIAIAREKGGGKPVIITDSGELSLWTKAAERADIFGTTMYKDVYSEKLNMSFSYPIGPNFFKFKKFLIKKFAHQENAIVIELQGEPWLKGWTTDFPVVDQLDSMDENKLKENVEFAQKSGFDTVYLWGAEWWYWMKTKKDYPGIWEAVKEINPNHPKAKLQGKI
jgi:hypothetical protein